jgi:hypothetical protein
MLLFRPLGILCHSLKIDKDNRLVTDHPGIVTSWQKGYIASLALKLR